MTLDAVKRWAYLEGARWNAAPQLLQALGARLPKRGQPPKHARNMGLRLAHAWHERAARAEARPDLWERVAGYWSERDGKEFDDARDARKDGKKAAHLMQDGVLLVTLGDGTRDWRKPGLGAGALWLPIAGVRFGTSDSALGLCGALWCWQWGQLDADLIEGSGALALPPTALAYIFEQYPRSRILTP